MDEARGAGFIALFGEKYGDEVRTLAVGDFSKELCGGTHVPNVGAIGTIRILSESAISAGNRRIEAVAGPTALAVARADQTALEDMAKVLKIPPTEVPARVTGLVAEMKQLKKDLEKATAADHGSVRPVAPAPSAAAPSSCRAIAGAAAKQVSRNTAVRNAARARWVKNCIRLSPSRIGLARGAKVAEENSRAARPR